MDHTFQAWFSSSQDYDTQAEQGLLLCPQCGDKNIEKAIMAPNVATSRQKDARADRQKQMLKMMNAAADKIRQEISDKCDYVGEEFADEARAIHYGEKPERAIYGQASVQQARSLAEEGIPVAALPDILTPKNAKKLN